MKFLMVVVLAMIGSNASYANEKGNGGFIDDLIRAEMEERETLGMKDLEKLTADMGEELKNEALIPLFENFLESDNTAYSGPLFEISQRLAAVKEGLLLDVKITHIKLGSCGGPTTCTGDGPYADILIDARAVLGSQFGTSISELTGLIGHEFLHHWFKPVPNHDRYPLGRHFKRLILERSFGTKHFKNPHSEWRSIISATPDDFCRYKGYKKALKYRLDDSRGAGMQRVYRQEISRGSFTGILRIYTDSTGRLIVKNTNYNDVELMMRNLPQHPLLSVTCRK